MAILKHNKSTQKANILKLIEQQIDLCNGDERLKLQDSHEYAPMENYGRTPK